MYTCNTFMYSEVAAPRAHARVRPPPLTSRLAARQDSAPPWDRRAWGDISGASGWHHGAPGRPRPPSPARQSVRGTQAHPWSAAAGRGGGAEATARWFRPPQCPILLPGPLKAPPPRAAAPRRADGATLGDPGDPFGRRSTPSGHPQRPPRGAGGLGWRVGAAPGPMGYSLSGASLFVG